MNNQDEFEFETGDLNEMDCASGKGIIVNKKEEKKLPITRTNTDGGQLTRTLNNKVKEQILKGREFEEDKQLETNKRITNTSEIRSRKTAPGKLITSNTRVDTSTRGGKRIDVKENLVNFKTSLSPDFLNLFAN